jgi:hypothetical protein
MKLSKACQADWVEFCQAGWIWYVRIWRQVRIHYKYRFNSKHHVSIANSNSNFLFFLFLSSSFFFTKEGCRSIGPVICLLHLAPQACQLLVCLRLVCLHESGYCKRRASYTDPAQPMKRILSSAPSTANEAYTVLIKFSALQFAKIS